jgi:sialic acid synthase SpsE
MIFQVAPLSNKIIETLKKCGSDVFTINAMDLTNPFMLDAVSESGKPFWLATLMGKTSEIEWSVNYLNSKKNTEFGLLHGQHIMAKDNSAGVPPEYSQLDCIQSFKNKYGCAVGYVDHTPSIIMPALAAAKGADIVFKHIAPEKDWTGPDYGVCLNPKDWKQSKIFFDYACKTHGSSKNLTQDEIIDRSLQRRSLYFNRDIKAGEKISINDLVALRPGGGYDPKDLSDIVGKKLRIDVKYGRPVDEKSAS